jgi:hypothetical protein
MWLLYIHVCCKLPVMREKWTDKGWQKARRIQRESRKEAVHVILVLPLKGIAGICWLLYTVKRPILKSSLMRQIAPLGYINTLLKRSIPKKPRRHCTRQYVLNLFVNVQQISFLYFNNIGLMQCSQTLSVISSTDWEKNHWSHETSPAFWVWARFAGSIFILPNTARSWYSIGGTHSHTHTVTRHTEVSLPASISWHAHRVIYTDNLGAFLQDYCILRNVLYFSQTGNRNKDKGKRHLV